MLHKAYPRQSSTLPHQSHTYLPVVLFCLIAHFPAGFHGGSDGKKNICPQFVRPRFNPWVRKIPWSSKWQPTPVCLPGEFCGERSLAGYSPWGHKESDTTEWIILSHFPTVLFHPFLEVGSWTHWYLIWFSVPSLIKTYKDSTNFPGYF